MMNPNANAYNPTIQPTIYRHPPLEDNYYRSRCCCNAHVERAAYWIAFLGALLTAAWAVLQFLTGNLIAFILSLFIFLVYWLILAAQKRRQPVFYMPFLILNVSRFGKGFLRRTHELT